MADRETARSDDRPRAKRPRADGDAARQGTAGPLADQQAAVGNQALQRQLLQAMPGAQAKLEVSGPEDAHEREADRVAEAVTSMPDPTVQRQADADEIEELDEDTAAPRLDRQADADEIEELDEETAAPRLDRQADAEEIEELDEDTVAPKAAATPTMTPGNQSAIEQSRGGGQPLDSSARGFFEPRLGRDLSGVRAHTGPGAARLASDMGAQAFTVGRDIYFAEGRYQPGTEAGRSLLAHELAHTVQQRPGAKLADAGGGPAPVPTSRADRTAQRQADEDGAGSSEADSEAESEEEPDIRPVFRVPQVKARHLQAYQAWATSQNLLRSRRYERGNPDQRSGIWIPRVSSDLRTQAGDLLESDDIGLHADSEDLVLRPQGDEGPTYSLEGNRDQILEQLAVPGWDREGRPADFDVDHIIELQISGWPDGSEAGNSIDNMELLVSRANSSAGGKTRWNVIYAVADELEEQGLPASNDDAGAYIADNDIEFRNAEVGSGKYAGSMQETPAQWWTRDEIASGDHLADAQAINLDDVGGADEFALLSPLTTEPGGEQRGGRALLGVFAHDNDVSDFELEERDQTRVAGLRMTRVTLDDGYTGEASGEPIGSVQAQWALPEEFGVPEGTFALELRKMPGNNFAGYLGDIPGPPVTYPGLSLIEFDPMGVEGGALSATGRLSPSVPLLAGAPIEVRLRGAELEFWATYNAESLELPVPGLSIDAAGLGVFYSTADGFGAEGGIDFSVERLGQGSLVAGVSSEGGLEIEGGFAFDSELFDEAAIDVWYREGALGGRGRLAINDPSKVPGVRSAQVTAMIEDDAFSAEGTVDPAVPGVDEAELSVSYSEEEGLAIGGTLDLSSDVPGIESGSVEATVRKESEEEGWKLTAQGEARPSVPGIDAAIDVGYDDGILKVEGSAGYERGLLSGSLTVGATNEALDDDGEPTGEPGDTMRAFGGGELTLQLAPWLEATAGVRLTPEGEVEVSGEIGLPEALEVFPERRYDRNILSIDIDIPIVGITVPIIRRNIGIFASIGGGLDLTAGFGPGELRELGLEITYNPEREEDTEVTGGAEFVVPADAGLRLFVRGALGAGIPVVDARLGLEVGGGLGIEGAVRAGVEVAWTPTDGIELDAEAEIFAEPQLKLDITGFASVEADVGFKSFDLYSERWRLAGFEYGSGLRLGATFPIHYVEGEPFDVSMDDIDFQVPDVDPRALLSGLVDEFT